MTELAASALSRMSCVVPVDPLVVISHATSKKRYSLTSVMAPGLHETVRFWAVVVRLGVVEPVSRVPVVSSLTPVAPAGLVDASTRYLRRMAFVLSAETLTTD